MSSEDLDSPPYQDLESKLKSLKQNLLAKSENEKKDKNHKIEAQTKAKTKVKQSLKSVDETIKLEPGKTSLPLKRRNQSGDRMIQSEKENRSAEMLFKKSKELESLAESTKTIFIELKNKILIEKCLNFKLNEKLEECVKDYNKVIQFRQ